ncbi:MAG TPA: SpoVR family protein, partial [Gammaproteobacteria bacterium]|nr:SpoVR family protein [Gammaproteobacteria bacterium]
KKAPLLEPWQREIVRIVRKISQYFYPQRQTQVMNEGWATFWHYTLLNDLYAQGKVTDGFMFEFLQSHSGVVFQPEFDSKYYSGINPYALGFAMFQDIKRICENPTEEDKRWFPDFAGSDWLATIKFAMQNFKDESFVQQFLSPKVMRDFKFFAILDDDQDKELEVSAIHDDEGYRRVREALSAQYNLSMNEPNIQVYDVDVRGSRAMTLRHFQHNRRPLADDSAQEVLKHLHTLWKFDVTLESVDNDKVTDTWHCPMPVANDEE